MRAPGPKSRTPEVHMIGDNDSRNRCETDAAAIEGIRRGLHGMYQGTGEDAEDAFASLEREGGIAAPEPVSKPRRA